MRSQEGHLQFHRVPATAHAAMPGGKHENMQAWSPEEDTIILEMHTELGPSWSKIVQRLPGRTVSSVRNRWQRIEKGRKQREAGVPSKNRCHACGLPKRGHVCLAKLGGGPSVKVVMGPPTVTITNHLGVHAPVRSTPVIPAPTLPTPSKPRQHHPTVHPLHSHSPLPHCGFADCDDAGRATRYPAHALQHEH